MLPSGVEQGIGPRERRWLLTFLVLGSGYFAVLLLQQATGFLAGFSSIMLILFLAWLLAFVMWPTVRFLSERIGLPRGLAASLAYLVALVALGALLFGLVSSITDQVRQLINTFPVNRVEATLSDWQGVLRGIGIDINLVSAFNSLRDSLGTIAGPILAQAQAFAGATIGAIGSFALILILSLYMVIDTERILNRINRIVPRRYKDELEIFERTVARAFGGFLRAQVILVVLQAALVIAVWVIFGLPYVFLVATLSALAMFIPFFGPPLALIPPILAAWIYGSAWWIPIALGLIAVQTVAVNWLQPRLMRGALGMHPILVLVALLVGAQVAGVWGALFGIPVVAVLNVFLNYFLLSEVPNVALPDSERLAHVDESTMVRVEKQQVSDETHPRIHVHRSLRADGQPEYEIVVDEDDGSEVRVQRETSVTETHIEGEARLEGDTRREGESRDPGQMPGQAGL